ncbi:MAG: energy transducer TonB [Bacteroidota bacterium]
MEPKKTPKADLENKKRLFVQIGIIFALVVVFMAFEYKQYERQIVDLGALDVDFIEEEDIPITRQETPPPPPPPEPSTELIIVDDDVEIEEEFTIDVDADAFTEVEEFTPVVVEEEEVEEEEIFTIVEDQPTFPGGDAALMKFLQENLKYPTMAREAGIQGTVFVTFVVETDGNITDVRILRGVGGGLDEEAIRVVQSMPPWTPGRQRGQAVRVQFNLPIRFVLN